MSKASVEQASELVEIPERLVPALAETDDALDAALCIMAGADFLSGKAVGPADDELEFATKEGWIWV